jgi:Rieske Fe-S protein
LERREFALNRLRATLQEKQLELEREDSAYILVGALSDLSESTGRYFIDYQMLPAMAFKGADGLPHILSAKCTHLGCTVGNTVDNGGKLCCPCHMSYFDVKDGVPDPNSLAVAPLPRLGWTLMDPKGKVLISRSATGTTTGKASPKDIASANVYIARDAAGSMS